ncbi:hypothetical protein [Jiangella muralis]|uniref:hypothetical protein n=1 Tax=Jiangella muralis TaxID=702383 RepID=UPI00069E193C|nr:hypothetical protein [Jiangella muralis]
MRQVACVMTGWLLLAGCGGTDDDPDQTGDGPLIEASTYYELTRVGAWSGFEADQLDDVGKALCSDMESLSEDEQRAVVLVLGEEADNELQAFGMALAITARHCPQNFHLWDDEVEEIMGGELPWER